MMRTRALLASCGVAAVVAFALVGCSSEPEPFAGYARTPTPNVADVTLPAVDTGGSETPFTFTADPDGLLLVYFGYTSCPDVCPTTLADVRVALDNLGDDGDAVDLAMVTIDVDVDTPEVLNGYVQSFVPDAVAVRTADDGELRAAATEFGADYGTEVVDGEEAVYHTGSLYVINDDGDLVLTWPFGVPSGEIESDLRRLLAGEQVV